MTDLVVLLDLFDGNGHRLPYEGKLHPIQSVDYLYLHHALNRTLGRAAGQCIARSFELEVLYGIPNEELWGNLYVKGIKCSTAPGLILASGGLCYGLSLNFIAPPSQYKNLGLGRNHNALNILKLVWKLCELFEDGTESRCRLISELSIYPSLSVPASTMSCSEPLLTGSSGESYTEEQLELLYPHAGEGKRVEQAAYLGAHVVKFSGEMNKVLRKSKLASTLERLWFLRKREAWNQPDYLFPHELYPLREMLFKIAQNYFDIPCADITFKAFPDIPQNPNQTIVINVDDTVTGRHSGQTIYLIDGSLFNRERIHFLQRTPYGILSSECRNFTCDCVEMFVMEGFKTLLCKDDPARERLLHQKMVRTSIKLFGERLPPTIPPPEPEVQPLTDHQPSVNVNASEEAPSADSSDPEVGREQQVGPGALEDGAESVSSEHHTEPSSAPPIVGLPPTIPPPEPEVQPLTDHQPSVNVNASEEAPSADISDPTVGREQQVGQGAIEDGAESVSSGHQTEPVEWAR
ncbi:hypothetical protein HKX48_002144 [Thoreauomyces humboldtii]|nr:hypothetical protein HKX48_002144 [Thoreauomyces humboldtii]